MPDREPTPEDGPLFRSAHGRADAVDRSKPGVERWKALARFVPSALAALAEGFLREAMITGAALFSVIAAVMGLTSGGTVWAIAGVASGVGGLGLLLVAVARRWSFGRQWAVILGVITFSGRADGGLRAGALTVLTARTSV